jgi:transcriptional regulator with XRE-family HTH domain
VQSLLLFDGARAVFEPSEHYYRQYIERTRQLRERAGYTAAELARRLGIEGATYRQYEHRSPLPLCLIGRFARFVQCDIEYLVTGDRRRARRNGRAMSQHSL